MGKDGKVFLDVSQNIMDRDEATSLGASRDQLKIWDVVNQVEIDTGGTGGVKKEVRMVEWKDTSAMSEEEKDAYAKELWEKLTGKKVDDQPK